MSLFGKTLVGAILGAALMAVAPARADAPLSVGVTAGPVALLIDDVAKRARSKGLEVKVVEFSDWVSPNVAVNAGDLDANFFQHATYLAQQNKARGFNLTTADPGGIIGPVGLFSRKHKAIADLPEGAQVAIPNDPVNGARGLILLEQAGLIRLTPGKGIHVTTADIVANPKKLKIIELAPGQVFRALDDVDLASVNFTSLVLAGGDPKTALIADLSTDEKFVFRFVTRPERTADPRLKRFIAEFKSPETRQFIAAKLPAFIAAW